MFASVKNDFQMCADDSDSSNSFDGNLTCCTAKILGPAVGASDRFDQCPRNCRDCCYYLGWSHYSTEYPPLNEMTFFDWASHHHSTLVHSTTMSFDFDSNQLKHSQI